MYIGKARGWVGMFFLLLQGIYGWFGGMGFGFAHICIIYIGSMEYGGWGFKTGVGMGVGVKGFRGVGLGGINRKSPGGVSWGKWH